MRVLTTFALAAVLSSSIAFAQETTGAGRQEISAFPGGGFFFGSSSTETCLLYTSPSPRDRQKSRMPSSA